MKKMLSLAMALLMIVLPMAALAEEPNLYLHPDESYGFAYPSDWILLSKETLESIYSQAETEEGTELDALLATYGPMLSQSDIVMVMSPNLQDNINIVRQDVGAPLTPQNLLSLAPSLKDQLQDAMPGLEFLSEPELIKMQEELPESLMIAYAITIDNMPAIGFQMITCVDSMLYNCTLTVCSTDEESQQAAIDAMDTLGCTLTIW